MTNKITIELLNNDVVTEIKHFKSIRELNKAYPQYEYHQFRQVYLFTNNKNTSAKKLQKNANLFSIMRIFDEDKYIENQKTNETINV